MSALVQELADAQVVDFVQFAAMAVLLYDTLLTFPRELELIWFPKFRSANLLYATSRYILEMLTGISSSAILLARVYAVTQPRRYIFSVLAILVALQAICDVLQRVWLKRCEGMSFLIKLLTAFSESPVVDIRRNIWDIEHATEASLFHRHH
ncbi:hypothetical protein BU17DRAFT_60456 [Hysterangium stoloniferum]|nr:hypothetical protein BU17DRAFT_60456 [Hysterangium stoloniferum]